LANEAENWPQAPQSVVQQQQEARRMGLDFDKLAPDEQRRVLDD
jgi:hypothetical protein